MGTTTEDAIAEKSASELKSREACWEYTDKASVKHVLVVNFDLKQMTLDEKRLQVSPLEWAIFTRLYNARGRSFNASLLSGGLRDGNDISEASLKVHISNLRKKLRDNARVVIVSGYDEGYRLEKQLEEKRPSPE